MKISKSHFKPGAKKDSEEKMGEASGMDTQAAHGEGVGEEHPHHAGGEGYHMLKHDSGHVHEMSHHDDGIHHSISHPDHDTHHMTHAHGQDSQLHDGELFSEPGTQGATMGSTAP